MVRVMGLKASSCDRMRLSETSSIDRANTRIAPAARLAAISGTVMRPRVRTGPAPTERAASSRVRLVCWNPATVERTIRGRRRTAYAMTRRATGFVCGYR